MDSSVPVSPSLGLHGPAFAHRSGTGPGEAGKLVEYSGGPRVARPSGVERVARVRTNAKLALAARRRAAFGALFPAGGVHRRPRRPLPTSAESFGRSSPRLGSRPPTRTTSRQPGWARRRSSRSPRLQRRRSTTWKRRHRLAEEPPPRARARAEPAGAEARGGSAGAEEAGGLGRASPGGRVRGHAQADPRGRPLGRRGDAPVGRESPTKPDLTAQACTGTRPRSRSLPRLPRSFPGSPPSAAANGWAP